MNAAASQLILVLCEAENGAKRIESHLRNNGHPIRTGWTTNQPQLATLLQQQAPHLVLCTHGLPDAPFEKVLAQCQEHDEALPVVLLSHHYTADQTLMALEAGARDQVSDEDARHLRHLEQVCLREIGAYRNHLQLQQTRAQTAAVTSRTRHLLTESTDAVASVSEGILTEVNPAFCRLLKYKQAAELIGLPLMDGIAPDDQARTKDYLKQLLKGKAEARTLRCSLLCADGSALPVDVAFSVDKSGKETVVQLLIRAPKAAAADSSAGRIPFMKRLKSAIEQATGPAQAAVLVTVDHFSSLEERLGFADSEEALLKLMAWLRTALGPQDMVSRVSSDELALIVAQPSVADLRTLCESLCARIQKEVFVTRHNEAQLTVSIAAYPFSKGENHDEIVHQITREARRLSGNGGNRSALLGTKAKNAEIEQQEALRAAQIKKAIEEHRLRLAFQSISSLEGDPRQHLDILLRLLDDQDREIAAAEFIGIAEKHGLMRVLDRWVTTTVLKMLARRRPSDEPISCFVKLSEETLKDADAFVAWFADAIKRRPLQPGELVFALQEGRLQNHVRKAKAMTRALHDLGAGIAIEHFGKAPHSVQLLDHIPAQFIKLDQSFTKDFNNAETQRTMGALMSAAKQRHIKVIVCHVEDANLMARLWQLGINLVQGFLVQEPALFPEKGTR